jgi:MraZ protein
MFRGQFEHSIDSKGRVSLPARFREALEATGDARVVIAPWPFEPCLHLHPFTAWGDFEGKISALPRLDRTINQFRRLHISRALDMDVDASGRVRVAPEHRAHAEFDKAVLWVGMGSHIELWSKHHYDAATTMTPEQFNEFRDKVEELIRV